MKKFNATPPLAFIIIFCAALILRAQTSQRVSGTGFQAVYREGDKLKAILTGKSAKQITGSQVFVTEFRMKILRNSDTNQVELIAEAPECLFDRATSVASSPGPMKAYTPMTNLYIQGVGFFCQQSNALLVISNKVETRINKSLFNTNSAGQSFPASAGTSTNQILQIFSDHFRFLLESNLVTYTGNVRVDDPQMELTCDALDIILTTNKTLERIVAGNRVVIVNKKDNSRATGDHAVYTVKNGNERVELTGNPFWSDGEQEGKANKFIFDRTNNLFRAEQNAVFKVPRQTLGQLDLLNGPSPKTKAPPESKVVISSEVMTFKMPPNKGPIQEMIAETNVVITSESDQSRATADLAVYHAATGLMELTGNPNWKMKESEIKADILVFGGTNHFFSARTNVYLKLPVAMFGKILGAGLSSSTNSSATSNQVVEVESEDFSYRTNLATFRQNVRAKTVDANLSQTLLLCNLLEVSFGASNQVETVRAKTNVFLQQISGAAAQSKTLEKKVTSQSLQLNRSPRTGLFESIHAQSKVVGEQTERSGAGKTVKRISAERVDIKFLPTTNQIENIVAEQNVVAEKIEKIGPREKQTRAEGQRAVYDSAGEIAELTGKPSATTDTILISDARVLRWDVKTGKMSATPYKMTPINPTNAVKGMLKP